MERFNDVTVNAVVKVEAWLRSVEQEDGSQGIEAAGAALAAAIIVAAVLGGAGKVAEAVTSAMERAASILG
jgi:hypothetical protein